MQHSIILYTISQCNKSFLFYAERQQREKKEFNL